MRVLAFVLFGTGIFLLYVAINRSWENVWAAVAGKPYVPKSSPGIQGGSGFTNPGAGMGGAPGSGGGSW